MGLKKIMITGISAGLLIAFLPVSSWSADKENKSVIELEKLTVTANKMEENVQDVPQNITLMDEYILEEKNIKNMDDLLNEVPNIMFAANPGYGSAMNFRGLNTSLFANTNPMVIYIDGVPINNSYGYDASFANVERIEVLRGPQGTIYGKDAIGGVINVVTKDPENEWHGKVGAEYGSFNLMRGTFNISGALVEDSLYLGINGQYKHDDGWIENTHEGMEKDAGENKTRRLSAYLLYKPTDQLSARLTVSNDYLNNHFLSGLALPGGASINDFHRDDAEYADYDYPTESENESNSQNLNLTYDFGSVVITSITTHRNLDVKSTYDADFSNNAIYAGLKQFGDSETDTWAQELRLSSSSTTGVRWIAGLYLETEDHDQDPYGMEFPYYYGETFYGNYQMNAVSVSDSENMAVFGQAIVPLGDRLDMTLGARFQKIDKEIDMKMYSLPIGMTGPASFEYRGDKSWDDFLPKAALTYQINDDWTAYASYSQGYMPGGFNFFATAGTEEDNCFEPEESTNYEMGIKASLNRLQMAASVFHMDIKNIHVYKAVGTMYLTSNAEKAHSMGIELEMKYRLTDTIELNGALGLIDTEYDSYDVGGGINFNGFDIQCTPSHTANIGIAYFHPRGLYSRVDMKNQGGVYFYDDVNREMVKEDAYTTVDAKIGYSFDKWDIYAYVKNLFDEEYITTFKSSSLISMAGFGDPRTIGTGIIYRF